MREERSGRRRPLNIFGPETIPQLNEIITALEKDD
jgi:hypothetical protein